MNYEERARYYQDELKGAPIESHMNFRCQKRLATWLRTQAAIENRDVSMIIRRLVNWAASQEGYDKNGG
jgi:hypothetical protein